MTRGPILCVDDEPSNLHLIRSLLSTEHKLVFARDGEEALRAVRKHTPSLILMDVSMPRMNGLDVARRLKADGTESAPPIIFITSHGADTDEQAGFDAGGVDYITKPISGPILRARVRTHLSLVRTSALAKSHREAISMLGEAGHYNDTDTGVHIWRMAAYARALAEATGWSWDDCELIEMAAPMHDTGKVGIPDSVLRKPGKLDEEEWKVMRTHSRIGYEILRRGSAPVFQMAAKIALRHHERWDGSGYPGGIAGEAIPESARVVAVADVFDALTMKRPYKDPWPIGRAFDEIGASGGNHLEPRLTEAFLAMRPAIEEIKSEWEAKEAESGPGHS